MTCSPTLGLIFFPTVKGVQLNIHHSPLNEPLEQNYLEYLRAKVAEGLADIERGDVDEWDPEAIKAEGRRIMAE